MTDRYMLREGLKVRSSLAGFIETQALAGLAVEAGQFWRGFSDLVARHMDNNRALLCERERLQRELDRWHPENGPAAQNPEGYQAFLQKIGYLADVPEDFSISTQGLDPEITAISGPQLVVPVSNARYALNAANARWGSLYDALYGTDAVAQTGGLKAGKNYNPVRGQAVFDDVAVFMDRVFPLQNGSHRDVTAYTIEQDGPRVKLVITAAGVQTQLLDGAAFRGYAQKDQALHILLEHNMLHIELLINREHPVGRTHAAGLADVLVESAVTVIQDCEDSVAAVDAQDKAAVYRNWLGLMRGDLEDAFEKNGRLQTRRLQPDRCYRGADGSSFGLKGRALMMVRNVGHLMMTDAVLDRQDRPVGEGLMDAAVTTLCAMHDRQRRHNSKTGAVYIVKPKMHGPQEVAFAVEILADVEKMLGLPPETVKIGIMDEERRTSANLKACIKAAASRIFFVNTGFLDRTGDEIHTAMQAGPVLPKEAIKAEAWLAAYEDRNVITALQCGFAGRAQIGKGMWAKPDAMQEMLEQKIAHPEAGANCAWVPSPTAATLHALHYHYVDVTAVQEKRQKETLPALAQLFSMPVLERAQVSAQDIQEELDNNAQGILGYVVRWVDQGVGCSKVPDIHNVALMEDRATCRISSQVIANWLEHGVVCEADVLASFRRMAAIVDEQNRHDPFYRPMAQEKEGSIAFQTALDLALKGTDAPSGYTEPTLHAARSKSKQRADAATAGLDQAAEEPAGAPL